MKYVMLFVDTEEFSQQFESLDQGGRDRAIGKVDQWLADNAGTILGGSKLQPAHTATTVRLGLDGGDPVVTDGPFVEGKEVVSGYLEVDVADLDEALRMARTWPGCPVVEIRPLENMSS